MPAPARSRRPDADRTGPTGPRRSPEAEAEPDPRHRPGPRNGPSSHKHPGKAGRRRAGALAALLLVGLPLLGATVDEASGPGVGGVFAVTTVLGTGAATALVSRAGWWWVVPAVPPLVLGLSALAEVLGDGEKYQDAKALGAGAVGWAVRGFPVMLAALATALLVALVRLRRAAVRRSADRRAEGARRG
ncbi:hypothetical protein CFP65_3171 [Kitasatospora sp. MMS16-BH015]|nr:hypothetical protein CFP65_3171 [Kitasatospora sp. MMS16-BH015]